MCICRIIFLTGASNNHNDSFPFFLSFLSFCALHRFRRARSALSCYPPWSVPFPLPSCFPALSILSALGGIGWRGCVLLWGGGVGVVSSLPAPSFPLRRRELKEAPCGCRCASCGWFWPLASAGPHIPVCPGCSCMLFAGMMALAGTAVVDHASSARHQSKGLGPRLVPLRTRPCSWGEGGVRAPPPPL